MLRKLARCCVGFALLILMLLPRANADGDPLERYDFTGKVPLSEFVQQSRTETFQHGLWTVQLFVEMNPFAGKTWDLRGNSTEKVNVYYGTRPMWSSDSCYRVSLSSLGLSHGDEAATKFTRAMCTTETESELSVVDCTGRDGITLVVGSWSGGVNHGHSSQLIRLSGETPATAKVEVLWSGLYEDFEDLDGDGRFEIIDKDWVHDRASYVPALGFWTKVVLKWDSKSERYALANGGSLVSKWKDGREDRGSWSREKWMAQYFEPVREAALIAKAVQADEDEAETARQRVLARLASGLTNLLWAGDLEAAQSLCSETQLVNYAARTDDEPVSRDQWWTTFVAGCKTSRYWASLCVAYPSLLEL